LLLLIFCYKGVICELNLYTPFNTIEEVYKNHYRTSTDLNGSKDLNSHDNSVKKSEVTLSAKSDISKGKERHQRNRWLG
jgi:hypothetical protein